jgi:hypothetical protein
MPLPSGIAPFRPEHCVDASLSPAVVPVGHRQHVHQNQPRYHQYETHAEHLSFLDRFAVTDSLSWSTQAIRFVWYHSNGRIIGSQAICRFLLGERAW